MAKQQKQTKVRKPTVAEPSVKLSLVIPCYNESKRIEPLTAALREFIHDWKHDYEIIIVDDGSADGVIESIRENDFFNSQAKANKFQHIILGVNTGKGNALKQGVLAATGTHVLTMDADLSYHPSEVIRWLRLKNGKFSDNEILLGSRLHPDSESTWETEQPKGALLRKIAGYIFNAHTQLFTTISVRDNQSGFKLYPAALAKFLFSNMHLKGWAHDVELLFNASLHGAAITEMPVKCINREGSKIRIVSDSMKMFFQTLWLAFIVRFRYYLADPVKLVFGKIKETETAPLLNVVEYKRESHFRLLFSISAIFLLFFMPYLSKDFGITGDEDVQKMYGERVLSFILTLGKDKSAADGRNIEVIMLDGTMRPGIMIAENNQSVRMNEIIRGEQREVTISRAEIDTVVRVFPQDRSNLHYYGGMFDAIAEAVHLLFPKKDIYEVRHALNALFGFFAIFFTGLIARQIGGWRAAFIALILIALTPRFFGHSMNNSKDIPFALAYVVSLYYMIRFLRELPRPTLKTAIFLSVGIAMSINIRVGGILLIAYFLLFTGLQLVNVTGIKKILSPEGLKPIKRVVPYLAVVVVFSYFGGLLFWPYGLSAPFTNPFNALTVFSKFPIYIRQIFEGEQLWSNELPWYYLPKYLLISNPAGVIAGVALSFSLIWFFRKKIELSSYGVLLFTMTFPVFYIIYKQSVVYHEWRHVLFIYPSIIGISAIGWELLIRLLKKKYYQYAAGVVFALFMAYPLQWMVKNHPHHYVFFNLPFGGVDEAHGYYETDYWMNSIKGAVHWLEENKNIRHTDDSVKIVSQAYYPSYYPLTTGGGNVKYQYTRYYERGDKDWDYAIFYSGYIHPHQLQQNIWPPKGTIHTINAENTPVCAIVKRENKDDYYGSLALNGGDYETAKQHYIKAVEYDPFNEVALSNLGLCYLNTNEPDKAVQVLLQSLNSHPELFSPIYFLGIAYAQTGSLDAAIFYLQRAIKLNPGMKQAYQMLGNIYQQKGDMRTAQQYFDIANRL